MTPVLHRHLLDTGLAGKLDADPIDDAKCLWVGAHPEGLEARLHRAFDAIALVADECQPAVEAFDPRLRIVRAYLADSEKAPEMIQRAAHAVAAVVEELRAGRRVLVTCMAGQNRSAMVAALALREFFGWDGRRAVNQVRRRREMALWNKAFAAEIAALPAVNR